MIKSFKKCEISIAVDSTENNLLWIIDDEVEIDSLGTKWNPYDEFLNNKREDVFKKLFVLDDECEDFAQF